MAISSTPAAGSRRTSRAVKVRSYGRTERMRITPLVSSSRFTSRTWGHQCG